MSTTKFNRNKTSLRLRILICLFFSYQAHAQISVFPYKENFDADTTLPSGWTTSKNKSALGDFGSSTTTPRSTPRCANASDARVNQWLLSPQFSFSGKIVDSIGFYERRTSTFTAALLLEASINNDSLFSIKISDSLFLTTQNNGSYQRRIFALPETLNNKPNVRFRWRVIGIPSGGSSGTLRFDDISISVKKAIDLALSSFTVSPLPIKKGETLTALLGIKNRALAGNFSGKIQLYDSLHLAVEKDFSQFLSVNETLAVSMNYSIPKSGRHPLTVKIVVAGDEDTTNNLLSLVVNAGVQPRTVLINEFMYAPQTGMSEWIEFVNNSADTISLSGWRISDAGTTKSIISPTNKIVLPYSYFVVAYDTNKIKDFYPSTFSLFQSPFSALNNTTPDAVVIYDNTGATIDSVMYSPSWGGANGKSLERIDTAIATVLQSNWATSKNPNGATPGFINSVTKKEYDLSVERIFISPNFPVAQNSILISAVIKNIGKKSSGNTIASFYLDANKDSVLDVSEFIAQKNISALSAGDSAIVETNISPLAQGTHWLFISISTAQDDELTNNILRSIFSVGVLPQSVVITEVMYAPLGDMPEFVECFNRSVNAIDISGWKISDAGTTKAPLSAQQLIIPPNTHFVVTTDTLEIKNYFLFSVPIFQAKFSALNNSTPDAVVLYDERGAVIDSLYYKQSWGGLNGNSLQRFDIFGNSSDSANWRSVNPSPGIENAVARKNFDVEIKRISSFAISHGNKIAVTIFNSGRNSAAALTAKIFHNGNNDSIAQQSELLYSENITALAPLDSLTIAYDWVSSLQGKQNIISTVEFLQDERLSNNTKNFTLTKSFALQTLVINEIMFDPLTGFAEFVELYNRSNDSVDVAEWKLMDQPSSTGSRMRAALSKSSHKLPPKNFIIVASDSTIFSQFPNLQNQFVVIAPSLSLNNSGEDIVLVDLTEMQIDSVRYQPSWHLKNITAKGRSLERINPSVSSNDARNWSSSVSSALATPALQNAVFSSAQNISSSLFLSPNPFSPDGDGVEDFLTINYSLPSQSAMIRVRIYDVNGKLIRRLANNEPSSANGTIIWNGLDDYGNRARIGMYIILLDALDNFGGTVRSMKDVAVVARKL